MEGHWLIHGELREIRGCRRGVFGGWVSGDGEFGAGETHPRGVDHPVPHSAGVPGCCEGPTFITVCPLYALFAGCGVVGPMGTGSDDLRTMKGCV